MKHIKLKEFIAKLQEMEKSYGSNSEIINLNLKLDLLGEDKQFYPISLKTKVIKASKVR